MTFAFDVKGNVFFTRSHILTSIRNGSFIQLLFPPFECNKIGGSVIENKVVVAGFQLLPTSAVGCKPKPPPFLFTLS